MRKISSVILFSVLAAPTCFAISSAEIQAGYAEMNRACTQSGASQPGTSASRACSAAYQKTDANSRQLMREIQSSMDQHQQRRETIQQEEIWREQVRRGYR